MKRLVNPDVLMWLAPWLLLQLVALAPGAWFGFAPVIGFPLLVGLPGMLIAAILPIEHEPLPLRVGYGLAGSVLYLILAGLAGNTVMHAAGIARPLDTHPLLAWMNLTFVLLLFIAWRTGRMPRFQIRIPQLSMVQMATLLVGPVLLVMTIAGAITLNNGGGDGITLTMLIASAVFAVWLLVRGNRLGDTVVSAAIYCMSLSFLLMTSLRGWYVTGHDVQREQKVFLLTRDHGLWDIAFYRDAYNACMSITILPTVFANLIHAPDLYVYKTVFQVLFAWTPVGVFLLARRFTSPAIALLATLYFISFPTYFGDMPMLNRQEVAFLFLILMLLTLFRAQLSRRASTWMFMALGLGMVLSHYSTTYSMIGVLGAAWGFQVIVEFTRRWWSRWKWLSKSAISDLGRTPVAPKLITIWMVIALSGASFVWTALLTHTSDSVTSVLVETVDQMRGNAKEDSKSGDVLYSLFSKHELNNEQLLAAYDSSVEALRAADDPSSFLSPSTYAKYLPVTLANADEIPLSSIGNWLEARGVDVYQFNFEFRQIVAKLLQVLIFAGLLAVLFTRRLSKRLPWEFLTIAAASLLFIFLQVVLPSLSVEYGLLRAFQQSLMVLSVFVVIGSMVPLAKARPVLQRIGASAVALLFMLSMTGVIPQVLGGYEPQLQLNNSGQYYDVYYTHESEVLGFNWLAALDPTDEVLADPFTVIRAQSYSAITLLPDIYPSMIRQNDYVFLGYTNVVKGEATFEYSGDLIPYEYPIDYLDQNKDLVYNNGQARVYH